MADQYFENFMRDSIGETSTVDGDNERGEDLDNKSRNSILKLLSMPDPALFRKFRKAASDLTDNVLIETWLNLDEEIIYDSTVYTGTLGTAYLVLRCYQAFGSWNRNFLKNASHIIKACDPASINYGDITFLCGRAGVCALGAVVANNLEDTEMVQYYLTQFKEIEIKDFKRDGMLYGRGGFLWACLYLKKNLGDGVLPSSYTDKIVNKVIENGRELGLGTRCPLMYTWFGTKYWGAAHGLAGILYVLMHFDLAPDVIEDVKNTLRYMIQNRLPSGNYPSEEDKREDILVHWCHGAPGMALTLVKAAEVYGDKEFVDAAIEAGEVVWKRGLLKKVGICHGISGNAYVFLALFRLTGKAEMLYRAKVFACFLLGRAKWLIWKKKMHGGDNKHSLFEGLGGMAYLFCDMMNPAYARFPGFEL